MLEIHRRLARVALRVAEQYGFVLAGGYAISQNGIGDRPSADVDLFTLIRDPESFAQAVTVVKEALLNDDLIVTENRIGPTFADLGVRDPVTGEFSDIQLGVNYREYPPAHMDVGPVLDIRDAVAGKMSALWSRGEIRDFIDIDSVITSHRFTREDVLLIADAQESVPMDRRILSDRFRLADRGSEEEYGRYNITPDIRQGIIQRFSEWADQIDPRNSEGTTD